MVAVLCQLDIVAAGDDMHGDAAARDLIERRKLARRQRRGREAGPVRDHQLQPLRDVRDMLGNQDTLGRGRVERDQHAVEPNIVLRLRHRLDMVHIDGGPFPLHRFR